MRKIHNNHKESDLQIHCVKYFRCTYPELARLLEHPKNEGHGDKVAGAIAKAEGVQAGVADLMLHVPSEAHIIGEEVQEELYTFHSMAIELKTKTGRQSPEQKLFQRYFEAAGGKYMVVRTFEDFVATVDDYVRGIPYHIHKALLDLWQQIDDEETQAARAELQRIINK